MKLNKNVEKTVLAFLMFILFFSSGSLTQAYNTSISFWNIDNQIDDVNNYSGIRIVAFFSPTCPACISEMSVLKEVDENFNVTIVTLDVYYENTSQTLIDFKTAYTLPDDWIMGYSTDESTSKFNISILPSIVILDDLGRIVAVRGGSALYEYFELKIDDAINYRTENYNPYFATEPNNDDLLKVLFIVIGVGVSTIVLYFLIQAIRRSSKESAIINATRRIEEEKKNSQSD